MRLVGLGALLLLSVLAGCSERHWDTVAVPPPPPRTAIPPTNERTLIEAPQPVTLPEPPLPALKPGIDLSSGAREALAGQASSKALVETQPTVSQTVLGPVAGQAANPRITGLPAPPLTDADQLVGLGNSDVVILFGPPAESKERPLSKIWTYHSAVCDVTLFFYPDGGGPVFRTLTYQIDERDASDATHHACLASLAKPHARLWS
jgi:hypothetical protein